MKGSYFTLDTSLLWPDASSLWLNHRNSFRESNVKELDEHKSQYDGSPTCSLTYQIFVLIWIRNMLWGTLDYDKS